MYRMLCIGEEEEDQEEGMYDDICHITVQNFLYRRGGGGPGGGNVR
jgi:hypothetical protein